MPMGSFTRKFFLERLSKLLRVGYGSRTAVRKHREAEQQHVRSSL